MTKLALDGTLLRPPWIFMLLIPIDVRRKLTLIKDIALHELINFEINAEMNI